jgi:hypothetical protein
MLGEETRVFGPTSLMRCEEWLDSQPGGPSAYVIMARPGGGFTVHQPSLVDRRRDAQRSAEEPPTGTPGEAPRRTCSGRQRRRAQPIDIGGFDQ